MPHVYTNFGLLRLFLALFVVLNLVSAKTQLPPVPKKGVSAHQAHDEDMNQLLIKNVYDQYDKEKRSKVSK